VFSDPDFLYKGADSLAIYGTIFERMALE